jgi:hypothetical protein
MSTLCPTLPPLAVNGNCRSASRVATMWSAAVFDPALPGCGITAKGSPVPCAPWSNFVTSFVVPGQEAVAARSSMPSSRPPNA